MKNEIPKCDVCNKRMGEGYHNYTCESYICDECYNKMSKQDKKNLKRDAVEYEYFEE